MKRRYHCLLNLCAFALLAFAFYLTFLKKETPEITPAQIQGATSVPAALTGETQKAIATVQPATILAHK